MSLNEEIAQWLGWRPFESVACGWTDEQNVGVPTPHFDEDFHYCERYLLPVLAREQVQVWFSYPRGPAPSLRPFQLTSRQVLAHLLLPGDIWQTYLTEADTFAGALCGAVKQLIDDGWEIVG